MASSNSSTYGFREVIIDEPSTVKYMEVDMNLYGAHSTFQGTKFSDVGGGFSYKTCSPRKSIVQNRCIYWRTLNDTVELTEISMDHNLFDNNVRYIFLNSPIVGPVTIHETDSNIVILVATVTSIHKFVFLHPKKYPESPADKSAMGNKKPSIFHQICNKPKPLMYFRSANLYENAINIPVPLSATSCFVPSSSHQHTGHSISTMASPQQFCNGDAFFAFSYESGTIQVIRIANDESVTMYDLNQANILVRFFSGFTPSILRQTGASADAVVGMSFFTVKAESSSKSIYLVTLGMNGHLRLWMGNNTQGTVTWSPQHSEYVHLYAGNLTDSCMLLKKSCDSLQDELPYFMVYVPNDGFRIYHVGKGEATAQAFSVSGGGNQGSSGASQLILQEYRRIDFRERELIDFSISNGHLHILTNNPEEETDWAVKSINLRDSLKPQFIPAVLEPLPMQEIGMKMPDDSIDPKEYYMDLIFNKSSFSKHTIVQALTMFKKDETDVINVDNWNVLRSAAMLVVDREIGFSTTVDMTDDEYSQMCMNCWQIFYNSCVEYHIHTVKPLGLFYDTSTKMLCIVKKNRISFLRPTDSLETMYHFPDCVPIPENIDGGDDQMIQVQMMLKYFEVIKAVESSMEEEHLAKLLRRLRKSHAKLAEVSDELANVLTEADPRSQGLEQRHFITLLSTRLKDMGEMGQHSLKYVNSLLLTWEREGGLLDSAFDGVEDMDTGGGGPIVTEYFMGSRLGAHLAYKILKQLLEHRFMIARSTVILQSLCMRYFSQNNDQEGIFLVPTWDERKESLAATTYYFALLNMIDEPFEYSRPVLKDKSLKVANHLKAFTADQLKSENFVDLQWPMRLLESFCISTLGGLSIRSRVSRSKKLGILAFAEAAGRSILPNDPTTKDHPLEEFLIATCQYSLLLKYSQYMTTYFPEAKGTLRKFYRGLSNLCLHNFDSALSYFRSISFREACDDSYFLTKYLEFTGIDDPPIELLQKLYAGYYLKIIKLFQIYDQIPAVQKLAEDGLKIAPNEDTATDMCSIAFKSAIKLDDYPSAYKYLMQIPNDAENDVRERKEKLACLRIFILQITNRVDVETLMELDMSTMFNKISTVREKVEEILLCKANLSDPLQKDGIWQMLYLYHIKQQNFHKAAAAMYFRVMQLGERGRGLEALQNQKESLLDVLTCLSLVEDNEYRFVIRKTGVIPEMPTPIVFEGVEIPPLTNQTSLEVWEFEKIRSELILCCALIKIAPFTNPSPVKYIDSENRVKSAIDVLIQQHYYDDAFELASAWDKPVDNIISFFTSSCVFLQKGITPQTDDPFDYIRHVDTSELPNSNTDIIELAFRILQNYLKVHSKKGDSSLYQIVALKLISSSIQLPQWLIDDYKKRNASQLLRCFLKYGSWEEATSLVLGMIDAILGRRPAEEFDPSIQKISAYDPVEPVLPFLEINILANEMRIRGEQEDNNNLLELHIAVKEKVALFCERVKECSEERKRLYL